MAAPHGAGEQTLENLQIGECIMFCGKCGKEISNEAKFCPYCGAATGAQDSQAWTPAPSQPPVASAPYPPQAPVPAGGKKSKGFVLLAAVGAAAVVAVAAAVVLFSGLFSGPKGTLAKAAVKSISAYQNAFEAAGMPDVNQLVGNQKVTQELSLGIKNISDELGYYYADLSMLEGMGFSVMEGVNLSGRKMDMSVGVTYGSFDVLSAWANIDDETVTFGSPQFLGGSVYGFNTETLGGDLARLGDVPDEVEAISFNIFDTLDALDNTDEVDKTALKDLADAIEVEKSGKETIDVNGYETGCTLYHVLVPRGAMHTYLSAVEAAYQNQSSNEALVDLMRSLGVPASDIEDLFDNKEAFDLLDEASEMIGDLELDVYENGGYIMAVKWSGKIEGTRVSFSMYLGGGKNYADDLSMELAADSARITLSSTGNHGAAGGAYTDETSVTFRDGSDSFKVTSEMTWDSKKSSDNFTWSVKSSGFALKASGSLTAAKNSIDLELDKLSVNALGTDYVTLSGSYSVKPYEAPKYSSKSPTMLSSMDVNDLEDLYNDVLVNTQNWMYDLMDEIPEIAYLFS